MDERHWLLATAYNTGIECLQYAGCCASGLRTLLTPVPRTL